MPERKPFPGGNYLLPKPPAKAGGNRLFKDDPNWDFDGLRRAADACEEIAVGEFGLDVYPLQLEVISSEQMLDAYSSVGLPIMYGHWSFGKHFSYHKTTYDKGLAGLAYEIVINSNPVICYIMEENSATMQTLVIAHAGFGHNHFFKNSELYRQWTDADGIINYLAFARDYVARCEERYGRAAVERVLDAAHALKDHGVDRYARRPKPNLREEERRQAERRAYQEATFNDLWRTLPEKGKPEEPSEEEKKEKALRHRLRLPEENLLYFLEKNAPKLEGWERELIRIVRKTSQYFYPQRQTQVMNEGCATFVHYCVMYRLWEKGLIDDGNAQEFLHSHSQVVFQPGFDDPRYSGINPYALGFAMMQDIHRITTGHAWTNRGFVECRPEQLAEDREWFPEIAGNGKPWETLRHAWANFRDESFISQYLSPKVIRDFRLFALEDDSTKPVYRVEAIHDDLGYKKVRQRLSRQYDLSRREPDIQVVNARLRGDRRLILDHPVHDGVMLEEESCRAVLKHVEALWGYTVDLKERVASSDKEEVLKTY